MPATESLLSHEQLSLLLAARLSRWHVDGREIVRTLPTENWKSTMLLAAAIGHLAEVAWHHPQLVLDYSRLTIRLHTHTAGGVTDKDIALADKIDALLDWMPASEGRLEGTPDTPANRYLGASQKTENKAR